MSTQRLLHSCYHSLRPNRLLFQAHWSTSAKTAKLLDRNLEIAYGFAAVNFGTCLPPSSTAILTILRMYSDLTGSPYGGATVIDFSTSTFNGPTQVADALLNVAAFILFSFSNVTANLIVCHSTIST